MPCLNESPDEQRASNQQPNALAHYQAQAVAAQFYAEAMALLEQAKPYVSRCNSIGAQQLSQTITQFLADNRRKQP
ncbi:hypothetical protein EQ826_15555 [Ectopseudomonas mendocina]|nr:hypothetical protein [Pseudomonas mendocina]TRO24873.1 hypothetical protein EQ826_15555 [Pseudomonas mendocina]